MFRNQNISGYLFFFLSACLDRPRLLGMVGRLGCACWDSPLGVSKQLVGRSRRSSLSCWGFAPRWALLVTFLENESWFWTSVLIPEMLPVPNKVSSILIYILLLDVIDDVQS